MMLTRMLGRTGLPVSALGLGTTEIGFVYGIGPRELPDDKEAISLLQRAVDLGVTFIDTGRYYGEAERRIAESGIAKKDDIVIATKCGHVLDRQESVADDELIRALRGEVEESLRTLKTDTITLLQLHGGTETQVTSGLLSHFMAMMKKEGKIRFCGISTRGEEAPLAAIADGGFDTLQLAHSILDQRMVTRVLVAAKKHDIGIINRSVLLKGALTPARMHLAPSLAPLKANADKAETIAQELGTDLPSLAIRFALSQPLIHTFLVGSGKVQNIERAAAAVEAGPLPHDVLEELRALAIDDPLQVDPKWWDTKWIADVK